MGKKQLSERLVETGLLTEENLTRALTGQRSRRGKLGEVEEDFGMSCPKCNYSLGAGFVICPRCGHALMGACRACQKMVSPESVLPAGFPEIGLWTLVRVTVRRSTFPAA